MLDKLCPECGAMMEFMYPMGCTCVYWCWSCIEYVEIEEPDDDDRTTTDMSVL